MAKPDIHPEIRDYTVKFSDGTEMTIKSTSKKGSEILENDYRKHPAWTGVAHISANQSATQVVKFNKKFAGIDSIFGKKPS